MTLYQPQYRMTVFALPSVDSTESSPAGTVSTAPHRDIFQVTTQIGQGNTLISDAFMRQANNTPGTADTGQIWQQLAGTWNTTGTAMLASNTASPVLSIDSKNSDQIVVSVDLVDPTNQQFIVFRGTDVNNLWVAGMQSGESKVRLFKRVAAAFTEVGTVGGVTVAAHTGHLTVVLKGTLIQVLYEGQLVQQTTDSFNQTGTLCGLFGQLGQFDNFSVKGAWQPYLQQFRGRRGKINPSDRSIDVGSITLTLLDEKVTIGQNTNRWVTAFLGDLKGRFRGKHKVLVEESLDNGNTWANFWTGRVIMRHLVDRAEATLEIRDMSDDLQTMMAFVGEPHSSITYAALESIMPVGVLRSAYGTLQPANPLSGTTGGLTINGSSWLPGMQVMTLDTASQARDDNVVTTQLLNTCPPNQIIPGGLGATGLILGLSVPVFTGRCRARITWTSGALSGQTGDYQVGSLMIQKGKGGKQTLQAFLLQVVDASDRFFLAMPASGVTGNIYMYLDAEINGTAPLFINDVDPAQLISDLCAGKFSYWYRPPETLPAGKNYGDVKQTIAANPANSAFIGTRPLVRFVIKQSLSLLDFIQKHLLMQMNWAIYLNKSGQLTLVDLTTPTSLAGLPTITDADCATQTGTWDHDATQAITRVDFTHYIDQPITPAQLVPADGSVPSLDTSGVVQEYDAPLIVLNIGSSDFTDNALQIDCDGLRAMQGEIEQNQDRFQFNQNYLAGLANQLHMPYGWGAATLPLVCRRTTTVTSLTQGALAILNVSWVPNPTTNTRGGTRVVRVLEVSENGPNVQLQLLDLGVNAFVNPPTMGALSQETNNTYTGATFSITLNAQNQPVECRYAVTPTSLGTIPADSDPRWAFGFLWGSGNSFSMSGYAYASGTTTLRGLAPGQRAWIQIRSISNDQDPHFPSAWQSPSSGNAYIDMAALPAPSALGSSLITGHTFRVSFTVGAADLQTLVTIAQPVGSTPRTYATLLPTSNMVDIQDLDVSTTYRVGISHILGSYQSAISTIDVTTTGSGTIAANVASVQVIT